MTDALPLPDLGVSRPLLVQDLLHLPVLVGATLLAGHAGLGMVVRRAHTVEQPDPERWVRGGELLLTTGAGWAGRVTPETFVRRAARAGVSALLVAEGRDALTVTPAMRRAADARNLPLLSLPWQVPFVDVLDAISAELMNRQQALIVASERIHQALTQAAVTVATVDALLDRFAGILRTDVQFSPAGTPLPGPDGAWAAVPVTIGREDVGRLRGVLQPDRDPDLQARALEHAATILALHLSQARTGALIEARLRYAALDALFSGGWTDTPSVRARAAALGYLPQQPYRVCLSAVTGGEALAPHVPEQPEAFLQREALARHVAQRLQAHGVPALLTVNLNRVEFLLPDDPALVRRFTATAPGETESVTLIGPRCERPEDLPAAHAELSRAFRGVTGPGVHHYEDLLLPRLLGSVSDLAALRAFHARLLGRLDAPGVPGHLRVTLQALVDSGFQQAWTARQLGVHLNTLTARVQRLETLLELDLGAPFTRFELSLALHLERLGPPR
ncbi:PucR family transcriptional regulator [Deinococcus aquiradiocola]|uniref:Transcriptional regulator n=1 Tax=Deinococcus aquiradiocola TaxID=393059 RepID=A0A917PG15_9DEIO|nr:PucR family transcriptional regulator ligand-binding domain-containing protein [Deinococcus aquiradiocola]GGJ76140.1 transcriptional regulator [Deinococcus aquiradiocola]